MLAFPFLRKYIGNRYLFWSYLRLTLFWPTLKSYKRRRNENEGRRSLFEVYTSTFEMRIRTSWVSIYCVSGPATITAPKKSKPTSLLYWPDEHVSIVRMSTNMNQSQWICVTCLSVNLPCMELEVHSAIVALFVVVNVPKWNRNAFWTWRKLI